MVPYPNNVYAVARALRAVYRDFAHHNKKRPLDELLFVLCSVKTTRANYTRTYSSLRRAFPRYQDLLGACEGDIAKAILEGGLSKQKAKSIKGLMCAIADRFEKVTLSPLRKMNTTECESFLTSLPGVGKKVARCVMMYSLERQMFPVDTHCWRACQRLGWVRRTRADGTCSGRDMDRLQARVPPELRYSLHVNLVSLGREFCTARRPSCLRCPVSRWCRRTGVPSDGHR
jgi:endonuclease III